MLEAVARKTFKRMAAPLGLLPMQEVVRGMQQRGFELAGKRALEVFGNTGERLTQHYAPLVGSLEVWELDPALEPVLRRNLPGAEIRIGDSYEFIRRTQRAYDFVVVDNYVTPREHFDLFPHVLRVLSDDAVLALLVVPEGDARLRQRYPGALDDEHLRRRAEFYDVEQPDRIPVDRLAARYGELADAEGLTLRWHFYSPSRELHHLIPYRASYGLLALKLDRRG